jgi:uncharacterized protein (TIGR02453 family)
MFTPSYIWFFKNLSENNNTAWFNENKKLYEKQVKKPFEAFVQGLLDEIHQISPDVCIRPADAIFRINKDTRFSEDKSPYKTEMSAAISRYGKKGNTCPGLYIRLGADTVMIGSGAMALEKEQLQDIRYQIAGNLEAFAAIIENEDFKATFGQVKGEKSKRLPEELREAAGKQPLLYNTTFYVTTQMPAAQILEPDFMNKVVGLYKLMLPFGLFFKESVEIQKQHL